MKLYDVKVAAEMLSVSPWTVRSWIGKGKLRPVRIGRLVRLDEEELERFVTQAKAGNGTAPISQEEIEPCTTKQK